MGDNRGILHKIKGINFIGSFVIQVIFENVAHNAPNQPLIGLILGDLPIFHDHFEVFLGEIDFEGDLLCENDSLFVNVVLGHLLCVSESLGIVLYGFVNSLIDDNWNSEGLKLVTVVMADVDPSGLNHQEEHRKEEADVDGNFDDKPFHDCSIELMELRLSAFVHQEPCWFFNYGCLFDIFEVCIYLVFFYGFLVCSWVVSVLSD